MGKEMKNVVKKSLWLVVAAVALWGCDSADLTEIDATGTRGLHAESELTAMLGKVEVTLTEGDLVAGQHMLVGTVTVTGDGTDLSVALQLTDLGFCIAETHIFVKKSRPRKQSPGRFNFNNDEVGCLESYTETIPYGDIPNGNGAVTGDKVYIAVHADLDRVGGPADLVGLAGSLPEMVKFKILDGALGDLAYFEQLQIPNGSLKGTYLAWCVDNDRGIQFPDVTYKANVFLPPVDDIPDGVVDSEDELDKVFWLLNNFEVGDQVDGLGAATFCDIQNVIWRLADLAPPNDFSGTGSCVVDIPRRDALLALANLNGDGFVPGCGDLIGIVLVPVNTHPPSGENQIPFAQSVIILHRVECEGETAWGYGSVGRELPPHTAPVQFDEGWGWYYDFFLP